MDFKEKIGKSLASTVDPTLLLDQLVNISNWRISKNKKIESYQIRWDDSETLDLNNITIHDDVKSLKNDLIYLQMASVWGKNSHCERMKVGCLMVKDKSIISDGYNGSPTGFPNICEDENMVTLPYVLHAEANAITKLAKSTQSSDGSTIYVTLSPCYECSKLIIQSGIKRVVFSEVYRKPESIAFLLEAGIEIVKISNLTQI
jgi:dCMP deaminase